MRNENAELIIKNIYRQSLRRIFFIKLTNNLIFFSIFGILLFDFALLIKPSNSIPFSNTVLILLACTLLIAIIKTYKSLPSLYYILATIDYNASTRGTFSLLNELTLKESENKNIDFLYAKSIQLIKSISLRSIFPWKFLWLGYFGAALTFTLVLWLAVPQHLNKKETYSSPTENALTKDTVVSKEDPLLTSFLKEKPAPNLVATEDQKNIDKNAVAQKNETQDSKIQIGNASESKQPQSEKTGEKKNLDEAEKPTLDKKASSGGSGTEEERTNKTTVIKTIADNNPTDPKKVTIAEASIEGSSERINSAGNSTKPLTATKLTSTLNTSMQKTENLTEMVSPKYQKIIERYFSSEE